MTTTTTPRGEGRPSAAAPGIGTEVDLDPTAGSVHYAGTADVEQADGGWVARRLPRWTKDQINDPAMDLLVGVPSGVRLELRTSASVIELDVALLLLRVGVNPTYPAAFDVVVDGALHTQHTTLDATVLVVDPRTGAIAFERGSAVTTMTFAGLPEGEKRVEIWLPHASGVTLRGLRVDAGAPVTRPEPSRRRRWIHYGSSISHCLEAEHPSETWPATVARLADLDLHSVAFAGQCQLDQFVARTIRERPAELISLKVGINIVNGDTMRERVFVPAVHGFLDTVREGHADTPIVLVSPIICPTQEDHPGPTQSGGQVISFFERPAALAEGALTLRRIRTLLEQVVTTRRDGGDTNLHLFDGLALFGESDVDDLPDGLHPNADGYRRMGRRFHDALFTAGAPFAV